MARVTSVTVNSVNSHKTGKGVIYEMKSTKSNFTAGFDYFNIRFRRHRLTLNENLPSSSNLNAPQSLQGVTDNNYISYSQLLYGIKPWQWEGNPLYDAVEISETPIWCALIHELGPREYDQYSSMDEYQQALLSAFSSGLAGAYNGSISNAIGYCACGTSLSGGGDINVDETSQVLPDVVLLNHTAFCQTPPVIHDVEIKGCNGLTINYPYNTCVPAYNDGYEIPPSPALTLTNSNFSSIAINGDEVSFFHPTEITMDNLNGCLIFSTNITDFKNLLYVTISEESRAQYNTITDPNRTLGELKNLHHAVLSNSSPLAIGSGNSYVHVYDSPKSVIDNFNYDISLLGVDNVHIKNNCEHITLGLQEAHAGIQNIVINDNTKYVTVGIQNIKNLEVSLPYNDGATQYVAPATLSSLQGITHIEKNSAGEVKEFCLPDLIQDPSNIVIRNWTYE